MRFGSNIQEVSKNGNRVILIGLTHGEEYSYNTIRAVSDNNEPDYVLLEAGIDRVGFTEEISYRSSYPTLNKVYESSKYEIPVSSYARFIEGERKRWHSDFEESFKIANTYSSTVVPADVKDSKIVAWLNDRCRVEEFTPLSSPMYEGFSLRSTEYGDIIDTTIKDYTEAIRSGFSDPVSNILFDRRERNMSFIVDWLTKRVSNKTLIFPIGSSHIYGLRDKIKFSDMHQYTDVESLKEHGVIRDGKLTRATCPYLKTSDTMSTSE